MALNLFNRWRRYRGQPDVTQADYTRLYHSRNYVANPAPQPAPLPPVRALVNPQIVDYYSYLPANDEERNFLRNPPPGLERDPADSQNWQGTKFLGEGGSGRIGLWEYHGPAANAPEHTSVVVKEVKRNSLLPPFNNTATYLSDEAEMMDLIHDRSTGGKTKVVHILAPVRPMQRIDAAVEGLPMELNDKTIRIFLEYCPLGDVRNLLRRRVTMQKPFFESTLWAIFECLADGIGVLETGEEFTVDDESGRVISNRNRNNPAWESLVHFDLKPENILLGDRNKKHQIAPICKTVMIADLGLAQMVRHDCQPQSYRTVYDLDGTSEVWRGSGTRGFYAPEQFTARWDFMDWQSTNSHHNRVAGFYSDKTNVWGVGCIMWQLAILAEDDETPSPKVPFLPTFNLNGHPPKGIVYGPQLRAYSKDSIPAGQAVPPGRYSNHLIEMIYECLYEVPAHRPTPEQLRTRIAAMYLQTQKEVKLFDPEPSADIEPVSAAEDAARQAAVAQIMANLQAIPQLAPVNQLNVVLPAAPNLGGVGQAGAGGQGGAGGRGRGLGGGPGPHILPPGGIGRGRGAGVGGAGRGRGLGGGPGLNILPPGAIGRGRGARAVAVPQAQNQAAPPVAAPWQPGPLNDKQLLDPTPPNRKVRCSIMFRELRRKGRNLRPPYSRCRGIPRNPIRVIPLCPTHARVYRQP